VRFWLGVAAVLALLSLSLRYAVPLGRSAQLAERLAEGRAELAAHPSLDAELEFLREVERTRAELDGLEILESIATSAPEGTRLSSVSLERGGDVFLVGSVTDQASANAFRSRLLATGRCETAVLEVSAAEGEVQFRMVVRMRSAPQPDTRE
jgi:hypothetical protein